MSFKKNFRKNDEFDSESRCYWRKVIYITMKLFFEKGSNLNLKIDVFVGKQFFSLGPELNLKIEFEIVIRELQNRQAVIFTHSICLSERF